MESQNKLDRHRKADLQNVCFRPPPNKTVYDKDSPPPYSSRSTSSLDSISHAKSRSIDINGCPVLRCYSMSENNNHSCFQQQQQFSRNSVSCRQIRQTDSSTGMSVDRPPDYPGRVLGTNHSVYHNSAAPAKNSVWYEARRSLCHLFHVLFKLFEWRQTWSYCDIFLVGSILFDKKGMPFLWYISLRDNYRTNLSLLQM